MCDKRNKFCYICGLFVDLRHTFKFSTNPKIKELYESYFSRSVEMASYTPEVYCSTCAASLKKWEIKNGSVGMPFIQPMIWLRKLQHKEDECYFCSTNLKGHHFKTRKNVQYADVDTVMKPEMRSENDCIPSVKQLTVDEFSDDESVTPSSASVYQPSNTTECCPLSQEDLNDLVRDLELSKNQAELLSSRLKERNLLKKGVLITYGRTADRRQFEKYFEIDKSNHELAYCCNIPALFEHYGHEHKPEEWRLFIDGSCKSEKTNIIN